MGIYTHTLFHFLCTAQMHLCRFVCVLVHRRFPPDLTQFLCPQNTAQWLWQHQPFQELLQKRQHTQSINVDVLYLSRGCNGSGLALDSFKHKGLVVGWYQQRRKTTFINNLWPIHRLSVSSKGLEFSFLYTLPCEGHSTEKESRGMNGWREENVKVTYQDHNLHLQLYFMYFFCMKWLHQ